MRRYRDRKRYAAYLVWRDELKRRQNEARLALARRQALQMADIQRRLRALDQIEQRERESLRQARRREQRQRINARHEHMPALEPVQIAPYQSTPPATPETAIALQMAEAAQLLKESRTPMRLRGAFARATDTEDGDGESGDTGTTGPAPERERKKRRQARSSLRRDFRQVASFSDQGEDESGGESSDAPKPAAEPSPTQRRRKKRKRRDGPGAADRRHPQGRDEQAKQDDAEKKERKRRRRPRRDNKPRP